MSPKKTKYDISLVFTKNGKEKVFLFQSRSSSIALASKRKYDSVDIIVVYADGGTNEGRYTSSLCAIEAIKAFTEE